MELKIKDYHYNDTLLNFSINSNNIIGITGTDKNKLIDIIKLERNYKGKIFIDTKEITKSEISTYKKKIISITEELEYAPFLKNIYQLMTYEIKRRGLILKNSEKKIKDSLKIVGLNENYLERNLVTLSTSEKKFIQLAVALLSNPDILIINEPFKGLDIKNEKKIFILLQKIKEQYKKCIIFISNDSNMLYRYTNYLIIFRNNKIIEGSTTDLFKRVDYLKRNKIVIPKIVEFTYLAKKKKNIRLEYHKDIRDIIKDIYKHV